jgi:large subunit ribosomal protein L4e
MSIARPTVSVYQFDNPAEKTGTIPMPHVLCSPLRPDWVHYVHMNMMKNHRQPYAVGSKVGYETAAESWGTGRAVARIPRAPGGGTHRAGQGAFGNMCRGGGMFSPTKTWRRWHRRINVREKRHAVVTALAASALPPLVMARGHRIDNIAEIPYVLSEGLESQTRTRPMVKLLEKHGFKDEMQKIIHSKRVRAGRGKTRNRPWTRRIGPVIIYEKDNGICRAVRNIPGVNTMCVYRLHLLKIAPGGHFGRMMIWTETAFKALNKIYGSLRSGAHMKSKYTLPRCQMENADIARIINSTEIQSVLRPKLEAPKKFAPKKNPLRNKKEMLKLNPYVKPVESPEERQAKKKARKEASIKYNKEHKRGDNTFWKKLMKTFEPKPVEEAEEED